MRVGLVSDTHGLVRPSMLAELDGCAAILHAGDIGGQHVLDAIGEVAPVHAIRGNVDEPSYLRTARRNRLDPEWATSIPTTLDLALGGVHIHMVHDLAQVGAVDADVIVVGHSHKPLIRRDGARLLVNPGSAGPRRFSLPISMALMLIEGNVAEVELLELAE